MPAPVCQPGTYTFPNLSPVTVNTEYPGGTKTSWVSYGEVVSGQYSDVNLIMRPNTVGALLASTFYVWYGRVTATLITAAGRGVITSFTLLSNTGDEIGHYIMGDDPQAVRFNKFSRSVIKGACKSPFPSLTNTSTYYTSKTYLTLA